MPSSQRASGRRRAAAPAPRVARSQSSAASSGSRAAPVRQRAAAEDFDTEGSSPYLQSEDSHLDRYGVALVLIVLTLVMVSLSGKSWWSRLLPLAFEGGTLLFILRTSAVRRRVLALNSAVVLAALLSAAASVARGGVTADWGPVTVGALLAVLAPAAMIRRLLWHHRIQASTIFGALCLYLTAGLFFAFLYGAIANAEHGRFFVQLAHARSIDYLYFSLVSLTTLGYGDLTPQPDLGRMLAVSEALIGQLYLVSVVALLVSNVGHNRPPRRTSGRRGKRGDSASVG